MELKKLKHDFQNNYLRLEVLLSTINDQLRNNEEVNEQYLNDLEKYLNLAKQHTQLIKNLTKSDHKKT